MLCCVITTIIIIVVIILIVNIYYYTRHTMDGRPPPHHHHSSITMNDKTRHTICSIHSCNNIIPLPTPAQPPLLPTHIVQIETVASPRRSYLTQNTLDSLLFIVRIFSAFNFVLFPNHHNRLQIRRNAREWESII